MSRSIDKKELCQFPFKLYRRRNRRGSFGFNWIIELGREFFKGLDLNVFEFKLTEARDINLPANAQPKFFAPEGSYFRPFPPGGAIYSDIKKH